MPETNLRRHFARRLKYLRQQKGMTQEDLAASAQLSTSFIRTVEQGKHAPSFESLEAIAGSLSVNVKDLFDFDETG